MMREWGSAKIVSIDETKHSVTDILFHALFLLFFFTFGSCRGDSEANTRETVTPGTKTASPLMLRRCGGGDLVFN